MKMIQPFQRKLSSMDLDPKLKLKLISGSFTKKTNKKKSKKQFKKMIECGELLNYTGIQFIKKVG